MIGVSGSAQRRFILFTALAELRSVPPKQVLDVLQSTAVGGFPLETTDGRSSRSVVAAFAARSTRCGQTMLEQLAGHVTPSTSPVPLLFSMEARVEAVLDPIDAVLIVARQGEHASDFDKGGTMFSSAHWMKAGTQGSSKPESDIAVSLVAASSNAVEGPNEDHHRGGCGLVFVPTHLFAEHGKELGGTLLVFPLLETVASRSSETDFSDNS